MDDLVHFRARKGVVAGRICRQISRVEGNVGKQTVLAASRCSGAVENFVPGNQGVLNLGLDGVGIGLLEDRPK